MRVLLVEDDPSTSKSIDLMLSSDGFNVYATDLGEEGLDLGKLYDYDIILLDLGLPDMNGYEVLKKLRLSNVSTPILILSGQSDLEDKVKALGFGADDYVTKPFHKEELVARIHAIIRRSKGHAQSVIRTGKLSVNLDEKTVETEEGLIHLTGKEYAMLDLGLPDMNGYEVLKKLRLSNVSTPILILSGQSDLEDKVKALGFGADDYVTKPFHKEELVARIHAIIRRSKGHAQSVIRTGKLSINLDEKTVETEEGSIHLTGKEYAMLELLSLRKGTTLTKEMFLNHLYGGMDEPELKIIDVFVCKLRKKLSAATGGDHYIETVWGRGYVLRDPEAEVKPVVNQALESADPA